MSENERVPRREARMGVNWKVTIEKLGEREQKLPPELAAVYERVKADVSGVGTRTQALMRDVSMNGAFVEGESLPLLSRVAMVMEVPGYRKVEAVGWVMWRRREGCTIARDDGHKVTLGPGFGVLFEWVSLEARLEIARRIARNQND
jgi:hypothetical protein